MRIKKIEIKDFRGIDSLTLEFAGPGKKPLDLVVLAGPNGCGKTSVLEACLRAFGRDDLIPRGKNLKDDTRYGSKGFSIQVSAEVKGIERVLERRATPVDAVSETRRVNGTGKLGDFANIAYYTSWRYPKLVGSVSVTAGKRGKKPSDTEDNRMWRLKQYLVNLQARKGFDDYRLPPALRDTPENVFPHLNRLWKMFYPDRDERFVALPASADVESGFDVLLERSGSERIPMDLLSSGEIEILCLLGLIVTKEERPDILFIDEPELHLHPAWHRTILRALRSVMPDTQMICATHSEEVLDSVYSYERFTILPSDDPRIRLVDEKVRRAL